MKINDNTVPRNKGKRNEANYIRFNSTYFQNMRTKTYGAETMISSSLQSGTSHALKAMRHSANVNANHIIVPDSALERGPTSSVAKT